MYQATVLIFDIDGTLIASGGSGRQALVRAFDALYGVGDPFDFPLDGLTDAAIARVAPLAGTAGDNLTTIKRQLYPLVAELADA